MSRELGKENEQEQSPGAGLEGGYFWLQRADSQSHPNSACTPNQTGSDTVLKGP